MAKTDATPFTPRSALVEPLFTNVNNKRFIIPDNQKIRLDNNVVRGDIKHLPHTQLTTAVVSVIHLRKRESPNNT